MSGDRQGSSRRAEPLFRIVLHEPEIPNNTGNVGRTCVALGVALHLIHPLGFSLDEKQCRRAGLDYWPRLPLVEHQSWGDYLAWMPASVIDAPMRRPTRWLLTTRSDRILFHQQIRPGDHLVFGRESRGLPNEILRSGDGVPVCLPMRAGERSLNLATAAAVVAYEGLRQCLARGEVGLTACGRVESSADIVFP